MKFYLLSAILFLFSPSAFAAPKATFAVFGSSPTFAEATCKGIPGSPQGITLRVPATDERSEGFETYVNLASPYTLVISASKAAGERTLFLAFAREDGTPVTGSTLGLDLGLRLSASLDVYCELNAGSQITSR